MKERIQSDNLIIPIYINEKIVLDMLAILEDGFSMVSQISHTEHSDNKVEQKAGVEIGTSASILSKLLKIDMSGAVSHNGDHGSENNVSKEKIHTNVSLLSKFRSYIVKEKILKTDFNFSEMQIGDFIEVEGELQKNPLIHYFDIFSDVFRLCEVCTEKASLGEKTQTKTQRKQENETIKQIQAFTRDLKHSGTIDFVLSGSKCSAVLSVQEKYLANDNVSEMIGGRFKILGKIIAIYKDKSDSIDLLRKTTLSILPKDILDNICHNICQFKGDEFSQYHFPELITRIAGPAVIVIPVAIYA